MESINLGMQADRFGFDVLSSNTLLLVLKGEWGNEYRYHYWGYIWGLHRVDCGDPLPHSPLSTSKTLHDFLQLPPPFGCSSSIQAWQPSPYITVLDGGIHNVKHVQKAEKKCTVPCLWVRSSQTSGSWFQGLPRHMRPCIHQGPIQCAVDIVNSRAPGMLPQTPRRI